MAPLDAVLFDLDSTLCVADQSDREIYDAVFDRVGVDPFFTLTELRAVDSADLPTAHTTREFYENLYRAVADDVGADPGHAPELAAATVEVVDETAVSFRDGAREALAAARERCDVGLVTNGGEETQTAKLERLEIADAFDVAVFCDPAAGVEPKPDPAPLRRALEALDARPDRSLFVGNSLTEDVAGAHAVGMPAAWTPVDREHEDLPADPDPEPTYHLESLLELSRVLDDLESRVESRPEGAT